MSIFGSIYFSMELNENEINFELNTNNFNAKVTFSPNANNDVFIPYSISHESNKYKITSIDDFSFYNNTYIKSINFPDNSQIKSFGRKVFASSSIEVVHIPPNLKELKEKWCNKAFYLSQCILSNKNKNFSYLHNFENQIILGKSDPKKAQYDTIVFASRDLENIIIPSSIKYIYPSIFSHFYKLKKVEFSDNSKLQQISEKAFSYTFIESITIPSSVKKICRKAFCECSNLKSVSFLKDSKLKTICERAFYKTKIEEIFIPSNVDDLEFLGEKLRIDIKCFIRCPSLALFSFPNADEISIDPNAFVLVSSNFSLFVPKNASVVITEVLGKSH